MGGCLPGPGEGFSLLGGVLPARGFSLPGGVSLVPGGACPETPPPVNRITDTCKNITLATTSLRPVIRNETATI